MRRFRMFRLLDDTTAPTLLVDAIHDDSGYREIRRSLSRTYDPAESDPDIQVVDVDLAGDRRLMLQHRTRAGRLLAERDAQATLAHAAALWGYEVKLEEIDSATEVVLATHTARAPAHR
jgi:stage V sporulation protein R